MWTAACYAACLLLQVFLLADQVEATKIMELCVVALGDAAVNLDAESVNQVGCCAMSGCLQAACHGMAISGKKTTYFDLCFARFTWARMGKPLHHHQIMGIVLCQRLLLCPNA